MFPLVQIFDLLPEGHLIHLCNASGDHLCTASCPAVIPWKYRDKFVKSVTQEVDLIKITLYWP